MIYILQIFASRIKIVVNDEEPKERRQLLCCKSLHVARHTFRGVYTMFWTHAVE